MTPLARQLEELRHMGASEEDLHTVLDAYLAGLNKRSMFLTVPLGDPGRGTTDQPVSAIDRVLWLSQLYGQALNDWLTKLNGKTVLVAGEFPPHLLEDLFIGYTEVTQFHPPDPQGYAPPHFHALAPHGLRGFLRLPDIAAEQYDVVLFHGATVGAYLYVSVLVPVVLRMYPNATVYVLEADHRAPHMTVSIPDSGIARIPFLL